jgi:hypothetical protein
MDAPYHGIEDLKPGGLEPGVMTLPSDDCHLTHSPRPMGVKFHPTAGVKIFMSTTLRVSNFLHPPILHLHGPSMLIPLYKGTDIVPLHVR